MRIVMVVTAGALLFAAANASAAAPEPPRIYNDEGACPFECCTYREWTVSVDTPLRKERRADSPVVATARKGATVQALTGTVITEPGRFEVLKASGGAGAEHYDPGEIVWVYTYLGEGVYRVWHRGRMQEEELLFMAAEAQARLPEEYRWARPLAQPKSIWWVQVRTKDGTVGWSDAAKNFGNKDGCG